MRNHNKSSSDNWIKECPTCHITQIYKTEKLLKTAIKRNSSCKRCKPGAAAPGSANGMFGRHHSVDTKKKIAENTSRCQLGRPKSEAFKETMRRINTGKLVSEATKQKLRGRKFSEEHKNKLRGRTISDATRVKLRLAARLRVIREIREGSPRHIPAINSKGCSIIDQFGTQHGYNFQHGMNGGEYCIKELGYYVDGYDPVHNVVIEYDEQHHRWHRQMTRDAQRQAKIVKHLRCRFIRLAEQRDQTIKITICDPQMPPQISHMTA